MFPVYQQKCENCLLSQHALVDPKRVNEIIKECLASKTHFICHKSTLHDNNEVCCRGFFDKYGDDIDKIQIFKRLNLIEFIELPDNEQLPSFKDFS